MNQKQFEILTRPSKIKVDDLENKSDRTLIYGVNPFDNMSVTYHLYLQQEMFHLSFYDTKTKEQFEFRNIKSFKYREEITDFICTVLKYNPFICTVLKYNPECCDNEFCQLLKSKGIILNYFPFDKDRPTKKYYGIKYEELKKVKKNGN